MEKRKKKSKELVFNLNLVPFIDLFSTLIIFLMATSVWDQLASVPISMGSSQEERQQNEGASARTREISPDLKVSLQQNFVVFTMGNQTQRVAVATLEDREFESAKLFFERARIQYPDRKDVVLSASDESKYSHLVGVMDSALEHGFDEIVVTGEI